MAKAEKMSKSRGNVVTVDEVIYGVAEVAPGHEFRSRDGEILDAKTWGIWRDRAGTGDFFTSAATGRLPAFLCRAGDHIPATLLCDGVERVQHPEAGPGPVPVEGRAPISPDPDEFRPAVGRVEGDRGGRKCMVRFVSEEDYPAAEDVRAGRPAWLAPFEGRVYGSPGGPECVRHAARLRHGEFERDARAGERVRTVRTYAFPLGPG